jgi:hypothetical protein
MSQDFQNGEVFSVSSRQSRISHVALFTVFPEAHDMLLVWTKKNIEKLNSKTA